MKELDQSESLKTAYSEAAQRPISSDVMIEGSSGASTAGREVEEGCCVVSDSKTLARRSSEGDLKVVPPNQEDDETSTKKRFNRKFRHPLIKSISLNTANEQESPLPSDRPDRLNSNILNSSMQTLVGDDCDDLKVDNLGGGGDSGIDPGEVEVFKFPPKIEASNEAEEPGLFTNTSVNMLNSGRQNGVVVAKVLDGESSYLLTGTGDSKIDGDLTPIPASPTFIPMAKPHGRMGNPLVNGTVSTQFYLEEEAEGPLPSSRQFISLGMTPGSGHVHDSFTTPVHRSSSPNAQSCASSEYSFCLPSPSFPWAPPSSPTAFKNRSKSLPTTPTHVTLRSSSSSHSSRKHFRFSTEITSHTLCSAVYPMNLVSADSRLSDYDDNLPYTARTHSRMHDFTDADTEEKFAQDHVRVRGKIVHFLPVDADHDLCKRLDDDFSRTTLADSYKVHRRSRSHSNPAQVIQKQSATGSNSYSLTYARSPPTSTHEAELDPYGVRPRPCNSTHHTTQQFKCYNIQQRRGVRLSNSAPNIPSLLSLHPPVH